MKPTVLLLCGLPYSGKSTLADCLAHDGFATLSLSAINEERGKGINGEPIPGHEWSETHRIARERLATYLSKGINVIWDDTNYASWIRDPIFETVIELGGEPVVVFVDTPVEEVRRRAAEAQSQRSSHIVPQEDFDRVLRDFERPCCGLRVDGTHEVGHNVGPIRRALHLGVLQ